MEAEWRDVAGYEGHYQVSNTGKVRSVKKAPHVLKGDRQRNGYLRVCLWLRNSKRNHLIHRLVAEAFIPNPNHFPEVNHLDENKENNNVENLEWCTHLHNLNYGTVKRRIGDATRNRKVSIDLRAFFKADTARRRWINNGILERYVYKEDVERWCATGFQRGRIKSKEYSVCSKK